MSSLFSRGKRQEFQLILLLLPKLAVLQFAMGLILQACDKKLISIQYVRIHYLFQTAPQALGSSNAQHWIVNFISHYYISEKMLSLEAILYIWPWRFEVLVPCFSTCNYQTQQQPFKCVRVLFRMANQSVIMKIINGLEITCYIKIYLFPLCLIYIY